MSTQEMSVERKEGEELEEGELDDAGNEETTDNNAKDSRPHNRNDANGQCLESELCQPG